MIQQPIFRDTGWRLCHGRRPGNSPGGFPPGGEESHAGNVDTVDKITSVMDKIIRARKGLRLPSFPSLRMPNCTNSRKNGRNDSTNSPGNVMFYVVKATTGSHVANRR